MSKIKLINLKMNYISQFSCKNLMFGISSFVLDNSLQRTRHAMRLVFAIFSCNLLRPYVFYCHFQVFSTCGMFMCHFVFQYCPQIIKWIEIWAVTGSIQRFDILLHKEITSTVLHEQIALINSHVNSELVLQNFAVIDAVHCCSDW